MTERSNHVVAALSKEQGGGGGRGVLPGRFCETHNVCAFGVDAVCCPEGAGLGFVACVWVCVRGMGWGKPG